MPLTPDFQFSQNNLQDYLDCPRRFDLRYLQRLQWPAPLSEPVLEQERLMNLGHRFHQMVHQHALNIPIEALTRTASDPDLSRWWHSYLAARPLDSLPANRFPEYALTAPLTLDSTTSEEPTLMRLVAKYDLLAIGPGEAGLRAVIIDWKTSRKRPPDNYLQGRLQSRVYPFLLVEAGAHLNQNTSILPEQVEMIYWFPAEPEKPYRFSYDQNAYQEDADFLKGLLVEIKNREEGEFPLTDDEKHCRFCNYRSYCDRGVEAGTLSELEDETSLEIDSAFDIDFSEIGEIEF
jgi:hypothetical protein